jgi:hypothetical protein
MAGTEVLAFILVIALVLIYALVFFAIIRAGTKGTFGWIAVIVAGLIGLLLIIYLIVNIANIVPADWAQIILTLGLVAVTSMYAWSTQKQANASVKMAEEMKDARFAALRPIVRIDWGGSQLNKDKNIERISVSFKNIGVGPALNLQCYLTHTQYSFQERHDVVVVEAGRDSPSISLSFALEKFDGKQWAGFAINCDYESIYGPAFRSTLKFQTQEEKRLEIVELK